MDYYLFYSLPNMFTFINLQPKSIYQLLQGCIYFYIQIFQKCNYTNHSMIYYTKSKTNTNFINKGVQINDFFKITRNITKISATFQFKILVIECANIGYYSEISMKKHRKWHDTKDFIIQILISEVLKFNRNNFYTYNLKLILRNQELIKKKCLNYKSYIKKFLILEQHFLSNMKSAMV